MQNVMRQIRQIADPTGPDGQSDEELLQQFLTLKQDDAFATLVRRHGPMVLGLCLRLLRHRQDAEDAFQATFITLVRKGHTIRREGALASWLYRVAFRIALRLKARTDRRRPVDSMPEVAVDADPVADAGWRELRPVLDQEVRRLPVKYRTPMVLCYLEGKTYDEVAQQMGCPKGTVAIRLLRGRQMLKARLQRRGLAAAAGCVATLAVLPQAQAALPAALGTATVSSAAATVAGGVLAQTVPTAVASLVREAGRAMWAQKLSAICALAACVGLSAVGVRTFTSTAPVAKESSPRAVAIAQTPDRPAAPQAKAPSEPLAAATPAKPASPVAAAPKADESNVRMVQIHFILANTSDLLGGGAARSQGSACYYRASISFGYADLAAIGESFVRPLETERGPVVRFECPSCAGSGLACREQMTDDPTGLSIPMRMGRGATAASSAEPRSKHDFYVQAIFDGDQWHVFVFHGPLHIHSVWRVRG
jgi:RNA polymerase sigma factor (sigma-70 family)